MPFQNNKKNVFGGFIVYRMQRGLNHLFTSEPIGRDALPACTGSAQSPHLQALPGPVFLHQVGGPAQPPLVVALEGLQHQVQDASEHAKHQIHSLSQAETAGATRSHTSCTTYSPSLASDKEAASRRASCWLQARKSRQWGADGCPAWPGAGGSPGG